MVTDESRPCWQLIRRFYNALALSSLVCIAWASNGIITSQRSITIFIMLTSLFLRKIQSSSYPRRNLSGTNLQCSYMENVCVLHRIRVFSCHSARCIPQSLRAGRFKIINIVPDSVSALGITFSV